MIMKVTKYSRQLTRSVLSRSLGLLEYMSIELAIPLCLIKVRPTQYVPWAVLRMLVGHPGRLSANRSARGSVVELILILSEINDYDDYNDGLLLLLGLSCTFPPTFICWAKKSIRIGTVAVLSCTLKCQ
jgi:hypothetical protein